MLASGSFSPWIERRSPHALSGQHAGQVAEQFALVAGEAEQYAVRRPGSPGKGCTGCPPGRFALPVTGGTF
jgi:hypothetical protein